LPGGILLAVALGLLGSWLLRLPVARLGDATVPAFGLSIVLVRIGCFVNGCCFGARSELPWAVRFPKGTGAYTIHMLRGWLPDDATLSLPVHPTQLYFAAVGLLMVGVGFAWRRVQRRDGETWLVALVVWGLFNPIVESFRDPDYLTGSPHLGLSGFIIGGVALLGLLLWRHGLPARAAVLGPVGYGPSAQGSRG
jgi:phosphatidylglycerol:prolipoprotein diacylglycerol transferase